MLMFTYIWSNCYETNRTGIRVLPNFIIVGAHKAGTTSLYQYCKEHPEIYMSPLKETNFLAYEDTKRKEPKDLFPIRTLDEYKALFSKSGSATAIGEASPAYLRSTVAVENIKRSMPDARLIVSLRHPVERAYSAYIMSVSGRRVSFGEKFEDINAIWNQNSFYYEALKRYVESFPDSQLKIILFDDLRTNTLGVVREIYSFLGVNSTFSPDVLHHHNPGGIPRNRLYHRIFRLLRSNRLARAVTPDKIRKAAVRKRDKNLLAPPPLSPDTYSRALAFFEDDIVALQKLVQIDLSGWLVDKESEMETS